MLLTLSCNAEQAVLDNLLGGESCPQGCGRIGMMDFCVWSKGFPCSVLCYEHPDLCNVGAHVQGCTLHRQRRITVVKGNGAGWLLLAYSPS